MRTILTLTLVLFAPSASIALAGETARKPNIIVILIDDLGFECIGANGGKSYKTPNLDKLAARGTRFTHCYAQPNCTPTRVQIMTGMSNVRNYVHFGFLEPSQITFGHLFRNAGYRTCIVGKWQLSRNDPGAPKHFGFDEHCLHHLLKASDTSRYINPVLCINGTKKTHTKGEYGPDVCHDFVSDFLGRNKEKPFFLYYPMILTHGPYQPTPDSKGYNPKITGKKEGAGKQYFNDMVTYMDKLVGKLITRLDELGLADNTLILFTGDNGTGRGVTSELDGGQVVDGGKGSTTVFGMHVPLLAYWPGKVPPGRTCDDLVDGTDFLPTICAASNVPLPKDRKIDGRSFLPQALGEKGEPREWIYSFWVPLKEKQAGKSGKHGAVEQAFNHHYKLYSIGEFYDIAKDPGEKKPLKVANLQGESAQAAKMLQAALDRFADARPPNLMLKGASPPANPAPKKK
jgi:arylsulfatase A